MEDKNKKPVAPKKPTAKPAAKKPTAKPVGTKPTNKTNEAKKPTKPIVQKTVIAKTVKFTSSLPKEAFEAKVNKQAIFDTIMFERASKRQGTHKVKTKAEVAGSGIKPWKQKGTGRARAGYRQSPIWVGGARAFGPTPDRNYSLNLNKKVRKLALASALTLKAKEKSVFVTEIKIPKISTKLMCDFIASIDMGKNQRKVLIVTEDEKVFKSASNLKDVETVKVNSISIEKIINADVIVLSKNHVDKLVEVTK